jgi:hypothetical protein
MIREKKFFKLPKFALDLRSYFWIKDFALKTMDCFKRPSGFLKEPLISGLIAFLQVLHSQPNESVGEFQISPQELDQSLLGRSPKCVGIFHRLFGRPSKLLLCFREKRWG